MRVSQQEIAVCGADGTVEARIPAEDPCQPLDWDAAGRKLLYSGAGVFVWEAGETTKVAAHVTTRGRLSPPGDRVVVGMHVPGRTGALGVFDVQTGEQLAERHFNETVNDLELSPDGTLVALGGEYRNVYLLDAQTLEIVENLSGHKGAVFSLAWAPDSACLVSVAVSGTVRGSTGRAS
ncbi:MAG: hypothetical protein GY711_10035 [bacterium]|nr:hypothetical protein [bacterium]